MWRPPQPHVDPMIGHSETRSGEIEEGKASDVRIHSHYCMITLIMNDSHMLRSTVVRGSHTDAPFLTHGDLALALDGHRTYIYHMYRLWRRIDMERASWIFVWT